MRVCVRKAYDYDQLQCLSHYINVSCAICVSMKKHLSYMLIEIKSARSLITLLQENINNTACICVQVSSWWMMKPSQNGVLIQIHPYLQKGAKCKSGKYRPVSSLGAYFLNLWIFRDNRGINPLNSINILAWKQFLTGKCLLEVAILYNCVHEIIWTLNNETYCSALFCDLVRLFYFKSWQ